MRATAADWISALVNDTLCNVNSRNNERSFLLCVVVYGVCYRRCNSLVEQTSWLVRHVFQEVESFLSVHPADDFRYNLCLLWRNTNVSSDCFHVELFISRVRSESASKGEFSEFVTYHVFSNENWSMNLSVVYSEGVTNEIRCNGTVAGPSLDNGFLAAFIELHHLRNEPFVDVRSFFKTTCHKYE